MKIKTSEGLEALFNELQENAYNIEYHTYYYKDANQIIRKHFELTEASSEVNVERLVKKQNGGQWQKYQVPNSMPCIKELVLVKYKHGGYGLDYWAEDKELDDDVIEFMRIP